MSWGLFKVNLKSTWAVVLSVTLFLSIYVAASVAMFDPESAEKMQQMLDVMPQGLIKAMGFDNLGSELTSYLANYLYGFIMLIFPMIGTSVLAHQLVAKHVDYGSMAYLLSTPNTRVKVIFTQAVYLVCAVLFMFAVNVGFAIAYCAGQWSGRLDTGIFIELNAVTVLVALAVGSLSFLASSAFSDTKLSISFGAGIPVAMFVLKMVSEISEDLSVLKYFSVYSLVDIERIVGGDSSYVLTASLILLGAVALILGAAVTVFNKKSLVI